MRDGIVVAAPCKVNTHLRVMDRRSDGFHGIESLFQALSFGDELRIASLKERSVCDVRMDGPVPPERNIVHKAVSAFRRETGWDSGVRIEIDKRIPFGAGLGGGSSDAAAALLALNRLGGFPLTGPALEKLAAELGSDVPFFLYGGTAYVSGRGERVLPIDARLDYAVVLAHPGFSSDTATAYRLLDQERASAAPQRRFEPGMEDLQAAALSSPASWPFFNDFLPVLRKTSPLYDELLGDLEKSGADFSGLSGSGSVCFGVYSDPGRADFAEKALIDRWAFVRKAVPLARIGKAVLE